MNINGLVFSVLMIGMGIGLLFYSNHAANKGVVYARGRRNFRMQDNKPIFWLQVLGYCGIGILLVVQGFILGLHAFQEKLQ
jgi:hypothetical protein